MGCPWIQIYTLHSYKYVVHGYTGFSSQLNMCCPWLRTCFPWFQTYFFMVTNVLSMVIPYSTVSHPKCLLLDFLLNIEILQLSSSRHSPSLSLYPLLLFLVASPGERGMRGEIGPRGVMGLNGTKGPLGPTGMKGLQGETGMYYHSLHGHVCV